MKRIILVFTFFLLSSCFPDKDDKLIDKRIKSVPVSVVKEGTIYKTVIYMGFVQGNEQVDIYPFQPGQITKIYKKEGSYIRRGEVFAELRRDLPGTTYKPFKVRSPISGRIVIIYVSKGMVVNTSVSLATVVHKGNLNVVVPIGAEYLKEIRIGSLSYIYVDKDSIKAYVTHVSMGLNAQTGRGKVVIKPVSNEKLIPNMAVKVALTINKLDGAIVIPLSAVFKEGENFYVYLVKEDRVKLKSIQVLLKNDKYAAVKGLIKGDTIVSSCIRTLLPGEKIKIIK